jgi:hypothetical protein
MQGRGVKQGWWLIQERRVSGLQRFGRNRRQKFRVLEFTLFSSEQHIKHLKMF